MKIKEMSKEPLYVVVNEYGEVFIGILEGKFQWSNDWNKAKPLAYSNTYYIRRSDSKVELIEENEFNK